MRETLPRNPASLCFLMKARMAVSLYTSAPQGPQYKLHQRFAGIQRVRVMRPYESHHRCQATMCRSEK
jgi:hypothetical protein